MGEAWVSCSCQHSSLKAIACLALTGNLFTNRLRSMPVLLHSSYDSAWLELRAVAARTTNEHAFNAVAATYRKRLGVPDPWHQLVLHQQTFPAAAACSQVLMSLGSCSPRSAFAGTPRSEHVWQRARGTSLLHVLLCACPIMPCRHYLFSPIVWALFCVSLVNWASSNVFGRSRRSSGTTSVRSPSRARVQANAPFIHELETLHSSGSSGLTLQKLFSSPTTTRFRHGGRAPPASLSVDA